MNESTIVPGDMVLDALTDTFVKVKSVHVDSKGFVTLKVQSTIFDGYRTMNDVTALPKDRKYKVDL